MTEEEMLTKAKELFNMMEAKEKVKLTFPYHGFYVVDEEKDSVFLAEVAVYPEARRSGHFTRLIKELQSEYNTVKIPVPFKAIKRFLERWGFTETTEFDMDTFEDEPIMVWTNEDELL